jgi:hypothetical protein
VTTTRVLLLILGLLVSACSETVGYLAIDLEIPSAFPPLACPNDPRRPQGLKLAVTCDGGTVEATYSASEGTVSLGGVPLGNCGISVDVTNLSGRVIFSGKASANITRGNGAPMRMTLLEERCDGPPCDSDRDGLADADEKALGTLSSVADSDGDGLEDGVEVKQCCTDPRPGSSVTQQGECRLLIQRVDPGYGLPGAAVSVVVSRKLEDLSRVTLDLGGAPLERRLLASPIAILGDVGPAAVLGEVKVASGQNGGVYQDLFAVLRSEPQLVAQLDEQAGAKGSVIQDLADLGFVGNTLLLLGTVAGKAATVASNAVLLAVDRMAGTYRRADLGPCAPIALAAGNARIVVLARDGQGTGLVVVEGLLSPGGPTVRMVRGLPDRVPVSLALEAPAEEVVEILYQDALQRLPITPGAVGPGFVLSSQSGSGQPPRVGSGADFQRCTGLAFHREANGDGSTYLACHLPSEPCPAGEPSCEPTAQIIRVAPVDRCLQLSGGLPPGAAGCVASFASEGPAAALGAPVVDASKGEVYQLASSGLLSLSLDASGSAARRLELLVPTTWLGEPGLRIMAAYQMDQTGDTAHLFVADGPLVWRLEPRQSDEERRRGRPFSVSQSGDRATMVAVSQDGTLLEVARRNPASGNLVSLMEVCLKRCEGCLCAPGK